MSGFEFDLEWTRRNLDYPEETATFAAVKAVVLNRVLTQNISLRLSTRRERVNVPVYSLALGIAREWWTLLYETDRGLPGTRDVFRARHRLDAFLPAFVFPPVALWSTGAQAVAVTTPPPDDLARITPLQFVERLPERAFLPRYEVEAALSDLVEAAVGRLGFASGAGADLRDAWDRVRSSLADPEERGYCESAGRLGIDPYDPDAPDLTPLAALVPEALFASLCEASVPDEIGAATEYAASQLARIADAPTIEVGAFSPPPPPDLGRRAAFDGYDAARLLRSELDLGDDPKRAVARILGPAAELAPTSVPNPLPVVEGVAERLDGHVRAVVAARNRAQQRFRLCRATYLAWAGQNETHFGITVARTRDQQASRAFSAELIAPEAFLREHAGAHGLATDDIDDLAAELDCSPRLIEYQIKNRDIAFRG